MTPFSSERHQWMDSKCVNIHDSHSPIYELTDEYDGRRALVKNFYMLLEAYQVHPEAKSIGPDGKPCEYDTRGLLRRAHIVANWPPIYIGKESDKHWEEGEDLSLLDFKAIEYKRKGNAIATDEQLARIAKVPKREFMRRGVNQHTLEKLCRKEPVRVSRLAKVVKVLQQWESEIAGSRFVEPYSSDYPVGQGVSRIRGAGRRWLNSRACRRMCEAGRSRLPVVCKRSNDGAPDLLTGRR